MNQIHPHHTPRKALIDNRNIGSLIEKDTSISLSLETSYPNADLVRVPNDVLKYFGDYA
jgi:hypothetical protein